MDITKLIENQTKVRIMYPDDSWVLGVITNLDNQNKIITIKSDKNNYLVPLTSVKYILPAE